MTDHKQVYFFGDGAADGDGGMRPILGGKGATLAEMSRIGLPVPAGFTIATEVSVSFGPERTALPEGLRAEIDTALARVEQLMDARFGDADRPLLLSVRSGAQVSMPGMMDTVLNVGLNPDTVKGLAAWSGDERFALDSWRRLIQMFGDVVLGVDHFVFEDELHQAKLRAGVRDDNALSADQLRALVDRFHAIIERETGAPFPNDPQEQLHASIRAVFASWHNDRARSYRELNDIPHDWGTAVNVQAMVFGNLGDDSATGVAFTRDPSTGENAFYGEFLPNAQGEDVVAGIRTPQPLRRAPESGLVSLEEMMPSAFAELDDMRRRLEAHFREMQDIEFTIQRGRVWMLQTRTGKRTAAAGLRIACEMVEEGLLSQKEAVLAIDSRRFDALLHPQLDPDAEKDVLARGLPASPGAATGRIAFTAEDAERRAAAGEDILLVRVETTPEDIRGMNAARGILTARGGMTSHAAVVARQMGRPCVAGCSALDLDVAGQSLRVAGRTFGPDDALTLDGGTGEVIAGSVPRVPPRLGDSWGTLMGWVDGHRRIGVRANADNGEDAALARRLGAEGIGLCRTEHMFFAGDRINAMREMIMSPSPEARRKALDTLRPFQQEDFEAIFRAMDGLPVTIRLLDPPLHEFLPTRDADLEDLAGRLGLGVREVRAIAGRLAEANPMLGHRGCRLGVTWPEIIEMQTRAILDAAIAVESEGARIQPEIMVPLVALESELEWCRKRIEAILDEYRSRLRARVLIGTMIELPRACLVADRIARHADFFSFGTNDLTQTTLGISRDDAATFLPAYIDQGLLQHDPFVVLDEEGVGALIRMAVEKGRTVRPDLKVGICGEHGGEPRSVAFVENGLVDYVSCSPYRVPVARLAAAQAALRATAPDSPA
ncbi:MAG: pyruvate, phosphate dikinase [Deltaproteobacteria bacterium]|nr:MAG: pyruvate, phosphate dikinase [Deltaproteobacteria bacterium]